MTSDHGGAVVVRRQGTPRPWAAAVVALVVAMCTRSAPPPMTGSELGQWLGPGEGGKSYHGLFSDPDPAEHATEGEEYAQ